MTKVKASLLVLAYFAFISLGLPDGLLGVGWPSIATTFHVSLDSVAYLLIASTTGYLTSSIAAGFLLSRIGVGWLLAVSTAMAGLALVGYATAPALWFLIPCALLGGLGGGAIDAGLNAYAATEFGPRHMNWLHACFGLGVAIGPVIMTSVIEGGAVWRLGYAIVSSAQLVLALSFVFNAKRWGRTPLPEHHASSPAPGGVLARPAVWLSVIAFAVYVAVEAGAGLWAFLLLTRGREIDAGIAGLCVSGYWAMLFLGRVVQGVVAERFGSHAVLVASLSGMALGSTLVAVPGPGWLAIAGLALIGFAAAPVFPLLTLTTSERVGAALADRVIGLQIGAAGLGGALVPSAIGVLLTRTTVEALGPALLVLSLLLIVLWWLSTPRHRDDRIGPVGGQPVPGAAPVPAAGS
ncbi:MFS transporter [Dactylosporangium sp. AC04546]|uniref:MFS transporter n=1 Tax=Dactylosporangium sp. AC04546 TaxID=2862460 RepID=UPI001EDFABCA|nr:MFS transporter [Dactylosporangium sp. AC04546]WVK86140.1 MFS transporter [Dactylosporangium sp. AC04546]